MKRAYTAGAIVLILLLGITYYLHHTKVQKIKIQVEKEDGIRKANFMAAKNERESRFMAAYPQYANIYEDHFSITDATVKKDTTIHSYIYFSAIPKTTFNQDYLKCLELKSRVEVNNLQVDNRLDRNLGQLKEKFKDDVTIWINEIGRAKLVNLTDGSPICTEFFVTNQKKALNESALNEFELLLAQYQTDKQQSKRQTENALSVYRSDVAKAKSSLNSTGSSYLNEEIKYNNLMIGREKEYSFADDIIGSVRYTFPVETYKKDMFKSILEEAYHVQYKNNSLYTGAKPYSQCFGSSNHCSGYSCSKVKVTASYDSDVVVTLKKEGNVVRHAYITSGNTYTFDIPNGSYQPFFYSGNGWNPNKFMKKTQCGDLKGGFVSGEHVGKDSPQFISNQILSYELIEQVRGNFNTKPSSKNEAF